jgi:uncharacterized protein
MNNLMPIRPVEEVFTSVTPAARLAVPAVLRLVLQAAVIQTQPCTRGSVLAVGEAKHTAKARSTADLTRLENIRDLIGQRRPAETAKLLLFSANGFDRNLTALADARPDVELIDLPRLYAGS